MSMEQIIALVGVVGGMPLLIEVVKKWFEGKDLKLRTDADDDKARDDRAWSVLQEALNREREVYAKFIAEQKVDFETRLAAIEVKLGTIQAEAEKYQRMYWEERVKREGLQARVAYLEYQLSVVEKIGNGR